MRVEEHSVQDVLIKDIVTDDTNPNVMTLEEENALEISLQCMWI